MDDHRGKIGDWGEFALLSRIVLPKLKPLSGGHRTGDDCVTVPIPTEAHNLIITTDSGPKPAIFSLNIHDYATWGWYCVLANASDLASAGAIPFAFTSSVEAPRDMSVLDFEAFFNGVYDACKAFGLLNAGGNIKDAPSFSCHGTALGITSIDTGAIGRYGCKADDKIVVIGECGRFITTFLKARKSGIESLTDEEHKILVRPRPKLDEMGILAKNNLIAAASDNSDGVLGSIWDIVEQSQCSVEVYMDEPLPSHILAASEEYGYNPWNLMFFWGDWQVICAIKAEGWEKFKDLCRLHGIVYQMLGRALPGPAAIIGKTCDGAKQLNILRNENFVEKSYFLTYHNHMEWLLRTSVIAE